MDSFYLYREGGESQTESSHWEPNRGTIKNIEKGLLDGDNHSRDKIRSGVADFLNGLKNQVMKESSLYFPEEVLNEQGRADFGRDPGETGGPGSGQFLVALPGDR
jgi:hypothetical protein